MQWFSPQSQRYFLFFFWDNQGIGKVQSSLGLPQFGGPMQVMHTRRCRNYRALPASLEEMQPARALWCYGSQVLALQFQSVIADLLSIEFCPEHNLRVRAVDFPSENNGGFQNLEFYKGNCPHWSRSLAVYILQRCFWSVVQMNS